MHEVQFMGVAVIPIGNPRIIKVEAWNNPLGGQGIDAGDRVTVTFNASTNGPTVIKKAEDVESIFTVYGDANQKAATLKKWGTPTSIEWSDAGGHADDTLQITMSNSGADLAAGDRLEVSSIKLKGKIADEEIPIISSCIITGSFDCSLVKASAKDMSGEQDSGNSGRRPGNPLLCRLYRREMTWMLRLLISPFN